MHDIFHTSLLICLHRSSHKHSISIETLHTPVGSILQPVPVGSLSMGLVPSFMGFPSFTGSGAGLPSMPTMGFVTGTLYSKFLEKEITNFEEFHVIILDIFNTFNSALPGKHYNVPPRKQVEEWYKRWSHVANNEKKQVFIDFMKENVDLSTLDEYTLMTGLVTPPVAMAAKKAGESLPQLKMIKVIPDVIFVPSLTVLALVSAKLSRKIFVKNTASSTS